MNINNKRGLGGKIILFIILILILAVIIIGLLTYNQAKNLINTVKTESPLLDQDITSLFTNKLPNCSKITIIEQRADKIYNEAISACKNPIINKAAEKMETIPIKCNQLNEAKLSLENNLTLIKNVCSNETLMNMLKMQIN